MTNDEIEEMAYLIRDNLPDNHYVPVTWTRDGDTVHFKTDPFNLDDCVGKHIRIPVSDHRNWWQRTMPLWLGGKNYISYRKYVIAEHVTLPFPPES